MTPSAITQTRPGPHGCIYCQETFERHFRKAECSSTISRCTRSSRYYQWGRNSYTTLGFDKTKKRQTYDSMA
eukprot:3275028-Ditylum_brightwellii.AAC.1